MPVLRFFCWALIFIIRICCHNDNLNNDIIDNRCASNNSACLAYEVNENIDIIVLYYRLRDCHVQGNMFPELIREK